MTRIRPRGGRTSVEGGAADLVVLAADPVTAGIADLRTTPVQATLVAGRWTWSSL